MKNMKINPEMVRKVSEEELILALAGISTSASLDALALTNKSIEGCKIIEPVKPVKPESLVNMSLEGCNIEEPKKDVEEKSNTFGKKIMKVFKRK